MRLWQDPVGREDPLENQTADLAALLSGWTPGRLGSGPSVSSTPRRRSVPEGYDFGASPEGLRDLEAAAAELSGVEKGSRWAWNGKEYSSRSEGVMALLCAVARRVDGKRDPVVAWGLEHLWWYYEARSDGRRDLVAEAEKACAGVLPSTEAERMLPPVPPGEVEEARREREERRREREERRREREERQSSGEGSFDPPVRGLAHTDHELAVSFEAWAGRRFAWAGHAGSWFVWTPRTGLWAPDRREKTQEMLRRFLAAESARVERLVAEGELEMTPRNLENTRHRLLDAGRVDAVLKTLRSNPGVATVPEEWDADDFLLGTPEGVVDLRSGETRPGTREERVSNTTRATPAGGGTPAWDAFLERIFRHDPELIGFMRRWVGYCLTGSTREQRLLFCFGAGANGKSTFLETLKEILGAHALAVSSELFMERRFAPHEEELAELAGRRLVIASEIQASAQWNEVRIKALTGGDEQRASFKGKHRFGFSPKLKLVLFGNHKPSLRAVDAGIRRRILLVPFTQEIPVEERDPDLKARLLAEAEGILAWAVEGCGEWLRDGLRVPASVLEATTEYLEGEDVIGQWLEARAVRGPRHRINRKLALDDYMMWSIESGIPQMHRREFYGAVEKAGFNSVKVNGDRCFAGFCLASGMLDELSTEGLAN